MRYAGIIYNDTAAAPGLSVSLFTQGCPFHCIGCHNQDTWDENGGYEYTEEVEERILKKLDSNGIHRSLSIMGGEPLLKHNIKTLLQLIKKAKKNYPNRLIYIWTGYYYKDLIKRFKYEPDLEELLKNIDILIDGPFEISKKDTSLYLRGSSNQNIISCQ